MTDKIVSGKVAVLMGSDSDWSAMQSAVDVLAEFDIAYDVHVMSAHRTPGVVQEFAEKAEENGFSVIIAGAGMSAALPGVVAAHTTLPVIGVPVEAGALHGVDALLSVAQMPPGIAVAAVGIGSSGARNAGILAVQMMAMSDKKLADEVKKYRSKMAESVDKRNQILRRQLGLQG